MSCQKLWVRLLAPVVAAVVISALPATPVRAAEIVRDGDSGVVRVIIWNGVTKDFLSDLDALTNFDKVYDYELIDGVALAVREVDASWVLDFAKARGLDATRDVKMRATLGASARPVHVKGAGNAWDLGYTGKGVTIAVIDSGIFATHTGLNDVDDDPGTTDPKVLKFKDYVSAGGNEVNPTDPNGHGTHVAGIAAGTGAGTAGDGPRGHLHVGMAYESNLVGLRVLDSNGTGSSTNIIAAINWVGLNANSVNPPIRVANISIGSLAPGGTPNGNSPQSQAVDAATARGITFAISAGNGDTDGLTANVNSSNISAPGDARTAITVCSTNSADPPQYSNWDSEGPSAHEVPKPEVCAPGDSIRSADNTATGYVNLGGTSMSSPHVAGIAALIAQAVPHITPAQIKQVIVETARNYPTHSPDIGYGQIQAREAIQLAVSRFGGIGTPLNVGSGGPYRAIVGESRNLEATVRGGSTPYTFDWDLDGDGQFDDATGQTATFSNTASPGSQLVRVRVTDGSGATDTDTTTLAVAPAVQIFEDNVEAGANGWVAASTGATTAAGWHRQSHHSNSPAQAWFAGNDTTRQHTGDEDVTLTRNFDFTTGQASIPGQQLLLAFAMSGSIEETFDFLHVEARPEGGIFKRLASYDDTDATTWQQKQVDISLLAGKKGELRFRWISDDFNDPFIEPAATGPYVDDIRISGTEGPPPDAIAPAAIADLAAAPSGTSVTLTWTAPGDDGNTGQAAAYDVRRATLPITDANFALATSVPASSPQVAGSAESLTVNGLASNTTYHFAVKTSDEAGNISLISNIVSAATAADLEPPTQVTGLVATPGDGRVSLAWDPATDAGGIDHYVLYQDGAAVQQPAVTAAVVTGLTNGTTYDFEVSAVDPSGNEGLRSAVASVTPVAPPTVAGWTHSRGGPARTGFSSGDGAIAVPRLLQDVAVGSHPLDASPVIADLDGDGRLDVVVVNDTIDAPNQLLKVSAFRQTDSGLSLMWTHDVPPSLATGSPPYSGTANLAVGDLDASGDAEIVVYSNYISNPGFAFNDGRLAVLDGATGAELGALSDEIVIGTDTAPAVGDVDGDGSVEVVFIRVTGGTEAGTYLSSARLAGGALVFGFDTRIGDFDLTSPALADLRDDPGLEVVIGEEVDNATGRILLCAPTGAGAGCNESVATTTGIRGISIADLDGDGALEIAANGRTGSSLNVVETAPALALTSRADGFLWNTPTLADVDGDGAADIVNVEYSEFANDTAKAGHVTVRGWTGTQISEKGRLTRTPATPGTSTQSKGGGALVDLVADGRPELVFGSGDGNLVAASMDAAGVPAALWSLTLPGTPIGPPAVGDVTGDGHLDLVTATSNGRLVVVGNRAPSLAAVGDRTVSEGGTLTFSLAGNDPDGDTLTFSGSNLPSGASVSQQGTFNWTPGFDQAGVYPAVRLSVTDGSHTVSEDITITVAETIVIPPAPVITQPLAGAILNTPDVTVAGTAQAGTTVTVLEGGSALGTAPAAPDGAWSLPLSFPDGEHTITATSTDSDGDVSDPSNPLSFTVDATAPDGPVIVTPSEGAVLSSPEVALSGTAEPDTTLTVSEDGETIATVPVGATGDWSVTKTFGEGPHTIMASTVDGAGNTSATTSRSFTISDTTPPAVPIITAPAQGAVLTTSAVTVQGTAEPGAVVRISDGGTLVGTTTAAGGGNFSLASTFSDGNHSLTATATDGAGNVSAPSAIRVFTVDTGVPISFDYVTNPISDPGDHAIARGTTEPGATVVVVARDGVRSTAAKTAVVDASGAWSASGIDVRSLNNGTITFSATATDGAGNTATAQRTSVKSTSAPPPVAEIVDDGFGHVPDAGAVRVKLTYRGPAADSAVTVSLTDENGGAVSVTPLTRAQANSPMFVTLDASSLADGVLEAEASFGGILASDTALLDRVPPTVTIDEPDTAYYSLFFFSNTVFTGTAADAGSGIDFVSVRLSSGNAASMVYVRPKADGTWTADFTNRFLPPGDYLVEARAFDRAGRASEIATATVTVV